MKRLVAWCHQLRHPAHIEAECSCGCRWCQTCRDETDAEHDKVIEYARKIIGRRDVHSVYEVLDWQAAQLATARKLIETAKRRSTFDSFNEEANQFLKETEGR